MLKFYNYLTRRKEVFQPLKKDRAGLYTCGPTVYNFAHIGNLRTYIFEDVLKRSLIYSGIKVRHIMNITDVEDKIIRDAQKAGKTIFEFVKPYEKAFFEDIKKLNILPADRYPKATGHIKEMVAMIQKLLEKKSAYQQDSSVYFNISKFKNYGKLSQIKNRQLKAGARVDADEYSKKDVQDFVLWKAGKAGEPSWKAPFGKGRPGWHIECSAMSQKYLGVSFDIHAGGIDLLFPHHENEIAQSEGASGKRFVRYFIEGEHLLVEGKKMAKSLGNIYTLRDIEEKEIEPLAFRYLILSAHYRSKLNFSWKSLASAQKSLERLRAFVQSIYGLSTPIHRHPTSLDGFHRQFTTALSNDLDTPSALASVWDLTRDHNKNPKKYDSKQVLEALYDFDRVLGFGLKQIKPDKIPPTVRQFAQEREKARQQKNWTEADRLREKIKAEGYLIKDTPTGPDLKKS